MLVKLPIVPLGTNSAASRPNNVRRRALQFQHGRVFAPLFVGQLPLVAMASRMSAVGTVCVSLRSSMR